jgi:hypothetical protein
VRGDSTWLSVMGVLWLKKILDAVYVQRAVLLCTEVSIFYSDVDGSRMLFRRRAVPIQRHDLR